jgi:hypothetical protein
LFSNVVQKNIFKEGRNNPDLNFFKFVLEKFHTNEEKKAYIIKTNIIQDIIYWSNRNVEKILKFLLSHFESDEEIRPYLKQKFYAEKSILMLCFCTFSGVLNCNLETFQIIMEKMGNQFEQKQFILEHKNFQKPTIFHLLSPSFKRKLETENKISIRTFFENLIGEKIE